MVNGQPVNSVEDGLVFWSNWSGMADVSQGIEVQRGLGASKLAISSVGGTINIITKTTEAKKGGFF
jgi:outer membrane receptor for ferrienterochelin and colicin